MIFYLKLNNSLVSSKYRPLKPNTVHKANTDVAYPIQEIKRVLFNFERFPNGHADYIFLSHINIIPRYIQNPTQR